MKNNKQIWRKDIDGLRALAVLAVVAFHYQFAHNEMGGGWLGVDIFFVISGFLITPMLLAADNFWDFVEFWGRRARRIFPSLILTLVLVGGLGYIYLLPGEFAQLATEATFGAGFAANFFYLHKIGEYFENQRGLNFLLNLWSLGVEEQYYIIFPFIIWALRRQKWAIKFGVIAILAVISWLFDLYTASSNSSAGFYLPYTRFWEILVGSGLAVWLSHPKLSSSRLNPSMKLADFLSLPRQEWRNIVIAEILCIFSLIILLWAVGKSADDSSGLLRILPNNLAWQTLPIVAVTGVILFFAPHSFIYRLVMGFPILRYIGLISFPLYLLHWPLIKFNQVFQINTEESKWVLLAVAVMLSAAFYHLVETPIRRFKAKRVLLPASAVLLSCGAGFYIISQQHFPTAALYWQNPAQIAWLNKANQAASDQKFYDGYMDNSINNINFKQNHAGDKDITLLFGNSHAYMMLPHYLTSSKNIGLFTGVGCGFFIIAHNSQKCADFNHNAEILASSPQVTTIIIAYHWQYYDTRLTGPELEGRPLVILDHGAYRPFTVADRERVFAAQTDFIKRHIAQGKKVVLVGSPPLNVGFHPLWHEYFIRNWFSLPHVVEATWVPGPINEDSPSDLTFTRQRLIKMAKATGAKYIDPVNYLCRTDPAHQAQYLNGFTPEHYECRRLTDDGEFTHSDYSHYTASYARNAAWMDEIIK
ncbi:MAG: acyltransferase family protein [Candidatus Symbiobacter sp.]|nr:acyltransferase family protein [Candidatus Symbiobacter sp.]